MEASEIHILSVGTALPGDPLDNAALARHFGMDPIWEQWVDAFVGTRARHLSVELDTGKLRSSLADLAARASARALENAGMDAGDIDLVVLGTATPDQLMPATVNIVADRLGIDGVPTYQLQSGCAGAFQALDVGRQMLRGGGHRTALVIGGELCSRHYDPGADLAKLDSAELVNFVLFGDGAGAAVLSTEPVSGAPVVRRVLNRLTGLHREPGQVVEWTGALDRADADRSHIKEDYKAIEESVPVMSREIAEEILGDLGWAASDVDYLLPPQLSGRMTRRIVENLDMPLAEEITRVDTIANTGNAMPFFQLEEVLPQLAPGDRVLGVSVESSKWLKAGFALELA
ncbi:3-oxoacyl-ACP synthase III family protein [Streptomyces albidoflavus]|uniref:3-oxoacyl-ACP synthase III family protein n=1 Tax=Streptomyces TaxID=1883 RepID=UPI00101F6130|nr:MULTISPECIES: 3-oxoacyl-ACP synthase III family protein [Streptomyces]QHC14356.1 3-oxoacyl-ACP synthase [Streptomyces sp. GF20]RZD54716.1 3-oxoacyl-ACP synthase [Streptomyces albidoflavus]